MRVGGKYRCFATEGETYFRGRGRGGGNKKRKLQTKNKFWDKTATPNKRLNSMLLPTKI